MTELEVKLTPRTDRIAELVEECANNEISFADLCKEVHEWASRPRAFTR